MVSLENNFNLLTKAIQNKDVKLLNCVDEFGTKVSLICIVSKTAKGTELIPIAKMLESNPYDKYTTTR